MNYLYTKETRSSFAIEGERPTENRASRFIAALKAAPNFDPTLTEALVRLQGGIVEPRYAATGWRDHQNFVGETVAGYREQVHFISPRPEDVAQLMDGWVDLYRRTVLNDVDPVVAAALVAFAFVFIHPFEDGNGRIHRFLIHHVLARTGFSPPTVIFPVSAAIVRDKQSYDGALEDFSGPIAEFIDWSWTEDQDLVVKNETVDLYRYFDATRLVEYLYDRVADTVRQDLREELGFVTVFDRAMNAMRAVVDMPDRRASLFVRLCMQNGGRLSATKRKHFTELADGEIERLELAVRRAIEAPLPP
ncbi:MAG: Fic family protein [Trueperaceae bacterium]